MSLVACPDCANQISSAAPTCPHCGRPKTIQTKRAAPPSSAEVRSKTLQNIVIGVVLFAAAMFFLRPASEPSFVRAGPSGETPATPPAPAPHSLTTDQPPDTFEAAESLLEKQFDAQFNIAPISIRLEGPHALETTDLVNVGDYRFPISPATAGKIVAEIRAQGFPCGSVTSVIPIFAHSENVKIRGWSIICSAGTNFYDLKENGEHRLVIFDETHKTGAETEAENAEE